MSEENKEIVVTGKNLPMSKELPMGEEAENIIKWANMMSDTKFYQQMVTAGGKHAIVAIFLTARDLDISPMTAINGGISCVQGRTMLSSQLMNMMIRRHGHSIKKKVGTADVCHLVGTRADNGDSMESIFTIQQAEKIGLTKNPVWKNYPERMLFNRALSNLAKDLFADCIGNSMVEGEIDSIDTTPMQDEPLDKESYLFIEKFDLVDLNCASSKFIDSIALNTGDTRTEVIRKCAKEPQKFQKSLDKFIEKTQAPNK